MIEVKNTKGEVVGSFKTKKEVAEFLKSTVDTDNSVKTISGKVGKSLISGELLFDEYKIEEMNEMEDVKNEMVEEKVEDNDTVEEIVEFETEEDYLESPEAEAEVEAENKEFEKIILGEDDDQATPEVIEELDKIVEEVRKDEQKEEEKKESKRTVGKILIAYKDGEEFARFKSIKAAVQHMKDMLGLGHMPFTPVMKSARDGIDWNEYSFEFENKDDLHIPKSRKKNDEVKDEVVDQVEDVKDDQDDEKIEEIIEIEETV